MRKTIALFALVGFLALPLGARAQEKLAETSGGFSYSVPTGWQTKKVDGVKYRVCHALPTDGFVPNLTVVDAQTRESLESYARRIREDAERQLKITLYFTADFESASGLRGKKLIYEFKENGKSIRAVQYFFGKGRKKYVLTGVALVTDGAKHDEAWNAAARSFVAQ